jgi:hypothetical protein
MLEILLDQALPLGIRTRTKINNLLGCFQATESETAGLVDQESDDACRPGDDVQVTGKPEADQIR